MHSVDLCTGPGPARQLEADRFAGDLHREHCGEPDVIVDKARFHRLMHGEDFIGARLPERRADGGAVRVLVYGASPTGAWCADYLAQRIAAEGRSDIEFHWVAPYRPPAKPRPDARPASDDDALPAEPLRGAFLFADVPGGRNTPVIRDCRRQGRLHLAEIRTIAAADGPAAAGRLKVTFQGCSHDPAWGSADEVAVVYDQVVTAIGQSNGPLELVGEPAALKPDRTRQAGSAAYLVQLRLLRTPQNPASKTFALWSSAVRSLEVGSDTSCIISRM